MTITTQQPDAFDAWCADEGLPATELAWFAAQQPVCGPDRAGFSVNVHPWRPFADVQREHEARAARLRATS